MNGTDYIAEGIAVAMPIGLSSRMERMYLVFRLSREFTRVARGLTEPPEHDLERAEANIRQVLRKAGQPKANISRLVADSRLTWRFFDRVLATHFNNADPAPKAFGATMHQLGVRSTETLRKIGTAYEATRKSAQSSGLPESATQREMR